MTYQRMIKALHKHIDNGHSVETLIKWWPRHTASDARVENGKAIFVYMTLPRKGLKLTDQIYELPVW